MRQTYYAAVDLRRPSIGRSMKYRFVTEARDYSDLSSGFVLRSAPGRPAFPVRVASELFLRAHHDFGGETLSILDPCCGAAYGLTVLGLLHPRQIVRIGAADIDADALGLARANLDLLSPEGLARRQSELAETQRQHGRPIHDQALAAADRLAASRQAVAPPVLRIAQADATNPRALASAFPGDPYDLVFADPPYGEQTRWQGTNSDQLATFGAVAAACRPLLRPGGVLLLVVRRCPLADLNGFRRIRRLRCRGRRDAFFFRRMDDNSI